MRFNAFVWRKDFWTLRRPKLYMFKVPLHIQQQSKLCLESNEFPCNDTSMLLDHFCQKILKIDLVFVNFVYRLITS